MGKNNLCIENVIYYHIKRNGSWQIGETKFIGKDKNNFLKYYDAINFTKQDPNTKNYYGINYLADSMVKYIDSNQKEPALASFYHFDSNQTVKEITSVLNEYLILVREWIFEEIRKDFFPDLPSRQRCLWVIPDTKEAIHYWWNRLGCKGMILKLSLTGKIYQVNQQHLNLTTNSLDYIRMQAFKYWSATSGSNPIEDECLFEGFATVLDIVTPDSLGLK